MTEVAVAAELEDEDPPAARWRVSFDVLASALRLPEGFQVIGIVLAPGAEAELIIAGPGLPESAPGAPLPVVNFIYSKDLDHLEPKITAALQAAPA